MALFINNKWSPLKEQKGAALITVVLMIVLVTALLMMALNISGIEMNLASVNRRTAQTLYGGTGAGPEIAPSVIKDILDQNALPTGYPATVVLDNTMTGGDPALLDLVEEITTGGGGLSSDSAKINPDVTITALNGQTILVDIDKEPGSVTLPGSELDEFAIGYHKKTGGTGCTTGFLYDIDTVASGALSTQSNVGSAYFNCS